MKQIFAVWSIPSFIIFVQGTPMEIKTLAFIAFYLTIIDMIVGVIAALACKEFRSHKMKVKWIMKILLYFTAVCLGYVLTILSGYWQGVGSAYTVVIACETMSLIEKLVKMQLYSNVKLGPLTKFIGMISPYFDIATTVEGGKGQTTMTHTAIISNDPLEPEIHVTGIETTTTRPQTRKE